MRDYLVLRDIILDTPVVSFPLDTNLEYFFGKTSCGFSTGARIKESSAAGKAFDVGFFSVGSPKKIHSTWETIREGGIRATSVTYELVEYPYDLVGHFHGFIEIFNGGAFIADLSGYSVDGASIGSKNGTLVCRKDWTTEYIALAHRHRIEYSHSETGFIQESAEEFSSLEVNACPLRDGDLVFIGWDYPGSEDPVSHMTLLHDRRHCLGLRVCYTTDIAETFPQAETRTYLLK